MRIASLATLLTLVAGSTASAQPTLVVARVVDAAGPWPACGRLAVRAEVLFETVEVEGGATFAPRRFVGVYDCPGGRKVQGTLRLTLGTPPTTRRSVMGRRPDASLPRFSVQGEELVYVADAASLIGMRRVRARMQYPNSRTEGEWMYFGERLSVRFEDGRVAEVRASVPPTATTCRAIATWAGYPDAAPALRRRAGCQWPDQSERHRLAARTVARVEDGVFRVARSPH